MQMTDWSRNPRRNGPRGSYDPWLLAALIALAAFGVVMVASSSIAVADSQHMGAFYYLTQAPDVPGAGHARWASR